MNQLVVIAHNLRSTHNIGAIFRTADGLGVNSIYLTGYTPYPKSKHDSRLPHLAEKINRQIEKTALGAVESVKWAHFEEIETVISRLRAKGFKIAALEQSSNSIKLTDYIAPPKLALIVGREVEGVEPEVLNLCDDIVEIPMVGQKESFNVAIACAIAIYQLTTHK